MLKMRLYELEKNGQLLDVLLSMIVGQIPIVDLFYWMSSMLIELKRKVHFKFIWQTIQCIMQLSGGTHLEHALQT